VLDLAWEPIEPPKPSPWYASATGQTGVTIAAALAIAGSLGTASAEEWLGGRFPPQWEFTPATTYPVKTTGHRSDAVPLAADPRLVTLVQPPKHVITSEPGGRLDEHETRFKQWAALGGDVEIRGMCQSACTLVMSNVPRERICFSKSGYLNFHLASSTSDGVIPSMSHTRWMIESYPADIRAWIEAKGGAAKMPQWTFWTLPAWELWQMGYRKCPD
jgi:hypothetical protein